MDFKRLSKVVDSAEGDVASLGYLDINNYDKAEDRYVRVGNQVVTFTCVSDTTSAQWNDIEDEYPYVYEVEVFTDFGGDGERSAMGDAKQWSSEDSAWYDGFLPAYKKACRKLGVEPMVK